MASREQGDGRDRGDQAVIRRMAEVVGSRYVLKTSGDLLAYSRDCWPRLNMQMRDGRWPSDPPVCVVQPGSPEQVCEIIRSAEELGIALVPFGAGSGVCGGNVTFQEKDDYNIKHQEEVIENK